MPDLLSAGRATRTRDRLERSVLTAVRRSVNGFVNDTTRFDSPAAVHRLWEDASERILATLDEQGRVVASTVLDSTRLPDQLASLTPQEREEFDPAARIEAIARSVATAVEGRRALIELRSSQRPRFVAKRWVSHHDSRTRPTHLAANGQTVAIEERFSVGMAGLLYPGDPSTPILSEIMGCRCVIVGVRG